MSVSIIDVLEVINIKQYQCTADAFINAFADLLFSAAAIIDPGKRIMFTVRQEHLWFFNVFNAVIQYKYRCGKRDERGDDDMQDIVKQKITGFVSQIHDDKAHGNSCNIWQYPFRLIENEERKWQNKQNNGKCLNIRIDNRSHDDAYNDDWNLCSI